MNNQNIPEEIRSRIEELRALNSDLHKKQILTDSLLISTSKKKEAMIKILKEYDEELYKLDNEIESYYNELFNELKLEKNKKILSNLNILKDLLENKTKSLNQRREQIEERESNLNQKICQLTPSQLELFNQIMSKIDQNEKNIDERLINTSNIKIEYEKMKNIYFNEISEEIRKMQFNQEKKQRNRPKSMDQQEPKNKYIMHNNLLSSKFNPVHKNNSQIKIFTTKIEDKRKPRLTSTKSMGDCKNENTKCNITENNKKTKSTKISRFQSKFFSQKNL